MIKVNRNEDSDSSFENIDDIPSPNQTNSNENQLNLKKRGSSKRYHNKPSLFADTGKQNTREDVRESVIFEEG